ncbi:flavin reductase family protein [Salinispora arenicola]|uniref:flavin reductase family protein n=2 Tax=Salinispora arenicola TaxID=168697 RepID=UPI0009B734FF|nr:flavin reductase family protein [Salinispora arenicola]
MRPVNVMKAHRLLAPRVAYLVGTRSIRGEANLIPVSNVTSISTDPELVTLAVFKEWTTYENLVDTDAFTLSVPTVEQLPGVWKLGARYSRFKFASTAAKLAASNLAILESDDLPAPVLRDGLGWLVCRKLQQVDVNGDHGIFLGEVEAVAFDSDRFDSEGVPTSPIHPLMQVTGNKFTTSGETVSIEYGD